MGVPNINGYADLTVIGQGGFAVVYRATQSALNRSVALKVLSGLVDPVAISRFERECATIGSLSGHPHVVSVYDAGTTVEGSPYLAMEYLPRGSLADRVQARGPLPTAEILSVGVQLCDALEAAHQAGVLHRDIKPENVLVDMAGQCKLADFGVAAVVEGVDSRDTAPGTLLGTVLHLAPEVLEGGRATVTSDVYSLGSTLATLALGKAPFARDRRRDRHPRDDADRPRPAARPAGGGARGPRGRGHRDGDGQGARRAVRIRRRVRQRAPADPEAHRPARSPRCGPSGRRSRRVRRWSRPAPRRWAGPTRPPPSRRWWVGPRFGRRRRPSRPPPRRRGRLIAAALVAVVLAAVVGFLLARQDDDATTPPTTTESTTTTRAAGHRGAARRGRVDALGRPSRPRRRSVGTAASTWRWSTPTPTSVRVGSG